MVKTYCSICKELICKYKMDWRTTGAITVDIGHNEEIKEIDVCYYCAKEIAREFVER